MTINIADNTPRKSYTVTAGNTSTSFDTEFEFFAEADLNVYVDGVKKTLSADYTVSGGNGSTGTVAISVTGASGNSTVVLTRSIALERTTDFPSQGAFQITSLNTELDRITAIQADLDDETQRSLRLADDDASVAMTLPLKATRVGTVLGFNATTGAPEAGPTIANVNSLSAITANINTVAGIAANVTTVAGISANTTTVAGIASNVTSVAGNASNINSAVSNASNINTVAGKASEITSVAAKASLITSDFVSDLNTLAVTDVINDINTLATSDIVSDLNTLATTDIVSDLNTLATTDIVSDINTLATSDIVTDLNLLATSDFVSDLNTLATSGNVTAVNNVSGSIANVNTVASNLASVNSFGETYRVSANAPTTSLDAGDLWFDTTNNLMKVYGASGFINAGSSVNGTANRFAWTVGTSSGSYDGSLTVFPATYDAGFVDVFLNGVKLLVGTDVTATNGTSVTLASAAVAADIVEIVAYGTFTAATELSLLDNKKIQLGSSQDLQLFHDGTDSHINVTGALTVDVSGDINLDAGGGEIYFQDDGATIGYLSNSSTDLLLGVSTSDKDLYIQGNDGGSTINALHLDMSAAGYATFNAGGSFASSLSAPSVFGKTDTDTGIAFDNGTNILQLYTANAEQARIDASGHVGIGTTAPDAKLHVLDTAASTTTHSYTKLHLEDSDHLAMQFSGGTSGEQWIWFSDDTTATPVGGITYYHGGPYMGFRVESAERMRIASTGKIETLNRDFGFFNHGTNVSLADDASIVINASVAGCGVLAIYETASGTNALYRVGYGSTAVLSGSGAVTMTTSDTDGAVCVFSSGHTITIKNRVGATKGFTIAMFMAGNTFAG